MCRFTSKDCKIGGLHKSSKSLASGASSVPDSGGGRWPTCCDVDVLGDMRPNFSCFSPHLYMVHIWTSHHLPRPTFPRSLLLVKHSCRPGPRQLSTCWLRRLQAIYNLHQIYLGDLLNHQWLLTTVSVHHGYPSSLRTFAAQAMALGLGLPQHFFDALTDRSFWCVRVIGYPALHREQLNLSCGEHTDYGCWTILAQVGGCPGTPKN